MLSTIVSRPSECHSGAVKVLFLTLKRDTPSTKWRILQFVPHLEKAGVECAVEEWPAGMLARLSTAKKAAGYDVTVLQKRLLPKLLVNRLRKYARSLVFEFDDILMLKRDEEGAVKESPTRERRFKRIVRIADAVVTTNEVLADLARRSAADPERVHVLPTVIDLARWEPRSEPGTPGVATVGWMGTSANLPSMGILKAPLVRLSRRYDALQVKVVCEEPLPMDGVRLVHKKFSPSEEVEDVRSFDIAVAPLVEDSWTRGKVSTKLLAYFAAGVPVVASDVNANRLYVRDGENGFLVGTLAQWEEKLARLIEDPALRRSVGAKARESVEREYSLAAAVPRYLALFERLAAAPK
jgi:glycosyltransferase involved in cell wall biosynthesis